MFTRCYNKKSKKYNRYGGRGITVCKEWEDFRVFLSDMGKKPSSRHSIDRKNNDGNYEPENCRWATQKQQQRNKSTNKKISYDGVGYESLSQLSEKLGISVGTLHQRINCGWDIDDLGHSLIKSRPSISKCIGVAGARSRKNIQ
jgi:hypothetical protein